jgi:hypothetical protein
MRIEIQMDDTHKTLKVLETEDGVEILTFIAEHTSIDGRTYEIDCSEGLLRIIEATVWGDNRYDE